MALPIVGILKGVASLSVSAGTGVVIGNLVKATTPDDISKFQKVMVAIGGYGITAVLSDLAANHVSNQIEHYNERLQSIIHPSEETREALDEVGDSAVQAAKSVGTAVATTIEAAGTAPSKSEDLPDKEDPKTTK